MTQQAKRPSPSMILDNNIYSYLAAQDAFADLDQVLRRNGVTLVTPPSVLMEAVRRGAPAERLAVTRGMAIGTNRFRPLPEVAKTTQELINLVATHQPKALLPKDDAATWKKWSRTWTRGRWDDALNHSNALHQTATEIAQEQAALVAQLRRDQAFLRAQKVDVTAIADWRLRGPVDRDGPKASEVGREAWRVHALQSWLEPLQCLRCSHGPHVTMRQWAGCYLNLSLLSTGDLEEIAYERMSAVYIPHTWLRWAVHTIQTWHRVERENLLDNQHSAYLVEVDLFVTADKAFHRAFSMASIQAPFPTARSCLLKPGQATTVVEQIEDFVQLWLQDSAKAGRR